jgi:hypothetical protein
MMTRVRAAEPDPGAAASRGDHVALVAKDAAGLTVGRVAYSRLYGPRAELALDVDAGTWHSGVPELLLAAASEHAARAGISTFLVRVPAADVWMLALLREHFAARESRDGAFVAAEFATTARHATGR